MNETNPLLKHAGLIFLLLIVVACTGVILYAHEVERRELEQMQPKTENITLMKCEYRAVSKYVHTLEVYGVNDGEYYIRHINAGDAFEREMWVGKFMVLEKGKKYIVYYKKLDTNPEMTNQLVDIEEWA
jgi:hypothetical protein